MKERRDTCCNKGGRTIHEQGQHGRKQREEHGKREYRNPSGRKGVGRIRGKGRVMLKKKKLEDEEFMKAKEGNRRQL